MTFTLDKATILDRLGGDEEIFAAMSDMFLSDLDMYCGELDKAMNCGRHDVLQREAHTVKGLLATFADEEGAAMALAIEQKAKLARLDGLEAAVADLKARLHLVAEAVKATLVG